MHISYTCICNANIVSSAIDQDEEDIFQCGKCKSQFTSLQMFVFHKRTHQKSEQTVDLTQFLTNDENQVMQTEDIIQDDSQYNSQETFQLGEPIILEGTDMLFRYIYFLCCDKFSHR